MPGFKPEQRSLVDFVIYSESQRQSQYEERTGNIELELEPAVLVVHVAVRLFEVQVPGVAEPALE